MATLQLAANQAVLLGTMDHVSTVYIKQYGSGVLRLASRKEDLQNDVVTGPGQIQDGIAQDISKDFQQYFWEGDLWAISDIGGPIVYILPNYSFYVNRLNQGSGTPSPTGRSSRRTQRDGLSTY